MMMCKCGLTGCHFALVMSELKKMERKRIQHKTRKPFGPCYFASTKRGDVILDPFFGTGTTGAVAKRLNRNFIGIEQDAAYVKIAKKRLSAVTPIASEDLLETKSRRTLPKVPFGNLIEHGLLKPGDRLFDAKKRFKVKVRADGSLLTEKRNRVNSCAGSQTSGLAIM